jgi:CHAT domain-containing protein
MNHWGSTSRLSRTLSIFCFMILWTTAEVVSAQGGSPAQRLQAQGTGKIDHWIDYVRRTGDAKGTVEELAAAESDLKSSYKLFLSQQDFAGAAWSIMKIADIKRLQNQFDQAAPTYQTAIELAQRAHRSDYETKALSHLALAEHEMGRMDDAREHSSRAVSLGANCGNKTFYFEALDEAGEVEVKLGNLVAAGDFLDRALAMSAEIDKRDLYSGYMDRADIYMQLARKCDYQRNYDVCDRSLELARVDYEKGLAITKELGYDFISQLFREFLEEVDGRKALIQGMEHTNQKVTEAADLFRPRKPKDVLVTESFAAGPMDSKTLAFAEGAFKEMQDWLARMQQQGVTVLRLDPTDLFLEGQLDEMRGDNDAALVAFLHCVDLVEHDRRKLRDEQARGRYLEDKTNYYYHAAFLLLDRKRYSEAFSLFEQARSRAMADMLASRPPNLGTPEERALFSQLQTLRLNIAAQQEKLFNLTGSQDRDQRAPEIVRLQNQITSQQQRYQDLEGRIAREAPKLRQLLSQEPVTLESVQRSAAAGGYDVLYYVNLGTGLVVWHINGNGVQVKKVFLPGTELTKKMTELRELLLARKTNPRAEFDQTIARELFLFLIQPVLSLVTSNHLVIIPHEELNSLPFQVLQNPETGKYLGESFAISYAPSATVLATLENRPNLRNGHLLAVADPGIHDAQEEVEAIGRLYPRQSKVVTQAPTTKTDLRTWVADYNLIHLSVHGKFDESDPLLSYLQFKEAPPDNGRFTAADMFGLSVQRNSLVVLSACETGRVEATHANEILGMVQSLLYAGAGDLVLSAWQVNAASTKVWMETFYREGKEVPPAEAARRALVAVKSLPEYGHPFFWSPFVMTGK